MKLAVRLARTSLRNHKLRSRLSTVGVVVSVFLVSLVFIISDSLKANIANQAANLTNQAIIINGSTNNSLLNLNTSTPSDTLNNVDAKKIDNTIDGQVISNLILTGSANFEDSQLSNVTTVATSTTNPADLGISVQSGSWFDSGEVNKKWVVLGENLANQLIGTDEPLNQVVEIKGQKFTVVGVIAKSNQPLSVLGYDVDNSAFISLHNGQDLTDSEQLSQIIVSNITNIDDAKYGIATILGRNHDDSDDYSIDTGINVANRLIELVNYLTIAACILAGVVLLVSCVSIANIMLVNVIERRREIGIRKAVGANTRNIMGQFVAESLIMSLRGGIIGLLLAYIVAAIALLFSPFSLVFSWTALGVGFVIPIIIGVLAGAYPAYRASRQDIIDALNQLT